MTIVLGSTGSLVVQAMRTQAISQRLARASSLAQNELEYWKAAGPAAVGELPEGTQPFQNPAHPADEQVTATLRVTRVDSGLVQLEAAAELPPVSTRPMRVSMCTWLGRESIP